MIIFAIPLILFIEYDKTIISISIWFGCFALIIRRHSEQSRLMYSKRKEKTQEYIWYLKIEDLTTKMNSLIPVVSKSRVEINKN